MSFIVDCFCYLRSFFWRIILLLHGGSIGKGTRIYERCKLSGCRGAPILIGENCYLETGSILSSSNHGALQLGNRVYIGEYSVLISKDEMVIGDDTLIAQHCSVVDYDHGFADPDQWIYEQPVTSSRVLIGKGVWMGAGVKILKGVSIGDGCIIGAGSVVNKDLPPNTICAGIPVRVLRERFADRKSAVVS